MRNLCLSDCGKGERVFASGSIDDMKAKHVLI